MKQAKITPRTPATDAERTGSFADGRQANAQPPLRSEGQRLLLAVPGSIATICTAVGSRSKATVADWRSGAKLPQHLYRERLEAAYGIPPKAWDQLPHGHAEPTGALASAQVPAARAREPKLLTSPSDTPTALEDVDGLLRTFRAELQKPDLTPSARGAVTDNMVRALALKLRLEKEAELLEDRIVRQHPRWARLKAAILQALVPFPPAARAVVAALQALEEDA